jgi:hypothetical protein
VVEVEVTVVVAALYFEGNTRAQRLFEVEGVLQQRGRGRSPAERSRASLTERSRASLTERSMTAMSPMERSREMSPMERSREMSSTMAVVAMEVLPAQMSPMERWRAGTAKELALCVQHPSIPHFRPSRLFGFQTYLST